MLLMGMREEDLRMAEAMEQAARKRAVRDSEAKGAYNERLRAGMAVDQLDRVITPLEDAVLDHTRNASHAHWEGVLREGFREEAEKESRTSISIAKTLTDVVRTLRRGTGIDAMTKVSSSFSEREEVVKLEDASDDR